MREVVEDGREGDRRVRERPLLALAAARNGPVNAAATRGASTIADAQEGASVVVADAERAAILPPRLSAGDSLRHLC